MAGQIDRDDEQLMHKIRGSFADLPVIIWTCNDSREAEKRVSAADYYCLIPEAGIIKPNHWQGGNAYGRKSPDSKLYQGG